MSQDYFGISYASLTLIGGLIGFIKAGSLASLIASSVCASAIYYGVLQNQRIGRLVIVLLLFLLLILVGGDARIIVGVSALLLVFFGNKYRSVTGCETTHDIC